MTWTEEDPWAADLGGISRMASSRRSQASTITKETITPLRHAIASVSPAEWAGDAASAFTSTAESLLPDLQLIVSGLENDASALDTYAAAIESIKQDAVPIRTHRDNLKHEIATGVNKLAAPDYAGTLSPHESQVLTQSVGEMQIELRHVQTQWDELSTRRRQADAAFVAALDTAASRGKLAALTGPGAATMTDDQLLAAMKGMSAADIKILLGQHPELLNRLASSTDPVAVNAWWNSLGVGAQLALIIGAPIVIGNLNGVPYGARDAANRDELAAEIAASKKEIARLEAEKTGDPYGARAIQMELAKEKANLATLESIGSALNPVGNAPRELISLTQDTPPLAAVSIGNLDTAKDVSYLVPGMDTATDSGGGLRGLASGAQNLYDEQNFYGGDGGGRAVVAWIGYVTPKMMESIGTTDNSVFGMHDATIGAGNLDRDLAGFNAVRHDSDVTLNVVGHSYGTTTASLALYDKDLHVSSFVSLASAGFDPSIPNADAIHADHVYVGEGRDVLPLLEPGKGDEAAWIGRDGSGRTDPANPSFGAQRFDVDGQGTALKGITEHGILIKDGYGYLSKGSDSLSNTALATIGQGGLTTPYKDPGPTEFETGLVAGESQPSVW